MPDLKKLEWYGSLAKDLVDNDANKKQRDLWGKIDAMDNCVVSIPPSISNLSWIGKDAKFADTLPHDSIQSVTRFLSTRSPRIRVQPLHPSPQEHERMEFVENVLGWHWDRMNRRNSEPVRMKIARSAAKYAAVAFQTKYMPYEVKRGGLYSAQEKKLMLRNGDFNWTVHNPQNIYATYNDSFLRNVLAVSVKSLYDLIEEYGSENQAIKDAIEKLGGEEKDVMVNARKEYVSVFDFTDCYCRAIWFVCNGSSTSLNTGNEDKYELLREEHKLPFIPWVVQDYGEPLLKGVVDAGLYDHLAVVDAIFYSKMLQTVAESDTIINAVNPNNPNLLPEEETPGTPMVTDLQTRITRLPGHQLDPQLMTAKQNLQRQLSATASVSALVAIEQYIGGNTPFSSINAAQSTAAAHLGPVQNIIERSIEEGLHQELQWIAHSDEPSRGFNKYGKGETDTKRAGMAFLLQKFGGQDLQNNPLNIIYFDPDELIVEVEVSPMTIQDKQAETNLAILMQQAGASRRTSLEKMGIANPDEEVAMAFEEQMALKMLEIDGLKQQLAAQLESDMMSQKMQMQMQQQGTPPNQQTVTNNMNAGAQFAATQGMDARFGGPAPANVVPGETRQTVTGKDQGGRPLA